MPALTRALAIVMLVAAPAAAERVLLADADPELQRAVRATLAPWRVEVVVAADPRPRDATQAQQIGDANTARFVVWRDGTDLVVFDRERGEVEHRGAPAGALDAASAAAAALTVKTLMRLPPPADEVAPAVVVVAPPPPPPPPDEPGIELRIQAGVAARVVRGDGNDVGGRASLAAFVKPTSFALRLGIAGELGTDDDVKSAGFKGTWSDWRVLAVASWSFPISAGWELEPLVGAGVVRSNLDGTEMMTPLHARDTLASVRAGVALRLSLGAFAIGGVVAFDGTLGTPTYTKPGTNATLYEVPGEALSLGFIVAADLGR